MKPLEMPVLLSAVVVATDPSGVHGARVGGRWSMSGIDRGHGAFDMAEVKLVTAPDETGEAEVVVRNDGLNVLAVKHEIALENDPDADLVQHFATLSFVAGHDHDD